MPTVPRVARLSLINILVPTDFSPASRVALPFAARLAEIYGSTVLLAHSIPPEPHRQVVTDLLPAQDGLVSHGAQRDLSAFALDPLLTRIPSKMILDRGELESVIPALVDENGVDLIVLGTHGRRGLKKVVLGSSAEKIYRCAACPVLTIGPGVRPDHGWKLRRILCPLDVAEDPEPVLQYALSIAEESESEFTVLEAIPLVPWQHRDSVAQRAGRALESLIPDEAKDWCIPRCVIRWEPPAEAILNEAREREVDLIVMSVHRSRAAAWSAHLPWPVASEVVSRATCPVLTLRV